MNKIISKILTDTLKNNINRISLRDTDFVDICFDNEVTISYEYINQNYIYIQSKTDNISIKIHKLHNICFIKQKVLNRKYRKQIQTIVLNYIDRNMMVSV